MDMSAGAGRIFAGFGGGHFGHGPGPGHGGPGVHGLGGHGGPGLHGMPGHEPGGHGGPGQHGMPGHEPGGHGGPGLHGMPGHGPGLHGVPGHEDWDGGPELARGGPPGGFPPHPPQPPQPPGFPGFPGGPGSFGGPGGWGGGGPWQRVREFRGGRPPARPVRPAVLALLAEEPMHGYQLMQEIRRRTNERWRPSPGSVYPILQQLEDEGLVHTVETAGRRVAELTDAGREHVAGREAEFAELWAEPEEEPNADRFATLWHALGELSGAAAQVGHSGTEAQVAEVKKILADARRRVYAVLADAGLEDEEA
ncbi:PadR family transcriptional regulator [Amycolatopsis lexingtonensis]|uniref:PadR family transcriptional regulator n=1 Tax=Amycolatopsis lexingtonensis TaxID=218822 RepID=UPI003F6F0201